MSLSRSLTSAVIRASERRVQSLAGSSRDHVAPLAAAEDPGEVRTVPGFIAFHSGGSALLEEIEWLT